MDMFALVCRWIVLFCSSAFVLAFSCLAAFGYYKHKIEPNRLALAMIYTVFLISAIAVYYTGHFVGLGTMKIVCELVILSFIGVFVGLPSEKIFFNQEKQKMEVKKKFGIKSD